MHIIQKLYYISYLFISIAGLTSSLDVCIAQNIQPNDQIKLEKHTKIKVREILIPLLDKYCGSFCQLIDINVFVEKIISERDDLGFESTTQKYANYDLIVNKVAVEFQIDDRVGQENQQRLRKIIEINLRPFGMESTVSFQAVKIPQILKNQALPESPFILEDLGISTKSDHRLALTARDRIARVLGKIVEDYCPYKCIIENIEVTGKVIPITEAVSLPSNRQIRDESGKIFYRVDGVDISITMDSELDSTNRNKIASLMKAKTKFVSPVDFNISLTSFPETYSQKNDRLKQESDDPYGLNKLKQLLLLFRDLASTKEIITTTTASSTREESSTLDATTTDRSVSSSQVDSTSVSKKSDIKSTTEETGLDALTMDEIALYAAGFLLLITLLAIILLKFASANKDAREMVVRAKKLEEDSQGRAEEQEQESGVQPEAKDKNLSLNLKVSALKDELTDLFVEQPKVAKETFSRLIRESGVEETAKYIKIFGYMVVFELIKDPSLQRDLYELSEYYHNSDFQFSLIQEYELLVRLKTKVTASEIKILTRKSSEKFDFLNKLDPNQIYSLISDEKLRIQSIVLTQLDRKRRLSVFDMFLGEGKVKLMEELSQAEAIPKEFLYNVAKALAKKVSSRPEFDTENIRATDVLLDLLEKADLKEQRRLMLTLQNNNPETARGLKMQLITPEMIPFLKDGHLLELVLSLERNDLLVFLAGCRKHISQLLLNKAPEELADSWIEDLEGMTKVDEQTYRVSERNLINKIRNLANNGVINLLDINEMIFESKDQEYDAEQEKIPTLNKHTIAA